MAEANVTAPPNGADEETEVTAVVGAAAAMPAPPVQQIMFRKFQQLLTVTGGRTRSRTSESSSGVCTTVTMSLEQDKLKRLKICTDWVKDARTKMDYIGITGNS